MFEFLELHAKGVIELSHSAGEHDMSPSCVLVDDGETVLIGELFYSLNVRRVGPELLVILLVGQVALGFVAGCYFAHLFLQLFMLAMPRNQSDLQPFARIGLSDRSCSRQWFPLATDKRIFWHSSTLLILLTRAAQDLRTALQRHEAAAGPKLGFSCNVGLPGRDHPNGLCRLTMPQIFVKIKRDRY